MDLTLYMLFIHWFYHSIRLCNILIDKDRLNKLYMLLFPTKFKHIFSSMPLEFSGMFLVFFSRFLWQQTLLAWSRSSLNCIQLNLSVICWMIMRQAISIIKLGCLVLPVINGIDTQNCIVLVQKIWFTIEIRCSYMLLYSAIL